MTLALLRAPHRLPPTLAEIVATAPQSGLPAGLHAMADLLSPGYWMRPPSVPKRDAAVEPRVLLALARTDGPPLRPLPVTLASLVVVQRDWAERFGPALARLGAEPSGGAVEAAQRALLALDGGRLASRGPILRDLRPHRLLLRADPDDPMLGPLLRGQLPELHRPARDALMQALTHSAAVGVFERLCPHLSICPVELAPARLLSRLRRDAAGTWLLLVQFADEAHVLGRLLDLAGRPHLALSA